MNRHHQIIADIAARGKTPIIVGGSNYYIQSLVSLNLIDDWLEEDPEGAAEDPADVAAPRLSPAGESGRAELDTAAPSHQRQGGAHTNGEEGAASEKEGVAEAAMGAGASAHSILAAVDPAAAARLHPNDHRRVSVRACGAASVRMWG